MQSECRLALRKTSSPVQGRKWLHSADGSAHPCTVLWIFTAQKATLKKLSRKLSRKLLMLCFPWYSLCPCDLLCSWCHDAFCRYSTLGPTPVQKIVFQCLHTLSFRVCRSFKISVYSKEIKDRLEEQNHGNAEARRRIDDSARKRLVTRGCRYCSLSLSLSLSKRLHSSWGLQPFLVQQHRPQIQTSVIIKHLQYRLYLKVCCSFTSNWLNLLPKTTRSCKRPTLVDTDEWIWVQIYDPEKQCFAVNEST